MKRAFIYKDEKSHKFWCIDYSGYDFSVNYGKSGYQCAEHQLGVPFYDFSAAFCRNDN